ncbi:hypothetical protein DPMN_093641 [Dreissena polymorpha]|uniref:Uncharacterized protein n=1 Tax=Dreissena polymorpha TaxID=45954 RepID=A0A9D4R2R5_DREPO|nr:hypothetical protein DPMN_093641 [Dreissena polymorpha]
MEQCEDCLMILIGDKDNASMPCTTLYSYFKLAEECNRERLMELCVIRISTFGLEESKNNMREFKITAKSDSKIANMACQRHERCEIIFNSFN